MFLKYLFILFLFLSYSLNACEKPNMPSESEWNIWLEEIRKEAKEKKISDRTINLYLSDVKPQKK